MIFDTENWLWKSEFCDPYGQISNRPLICQRPFTVRKFYLPFNLPRVWCGTCRKKFKWYLGTTYIYFWKSADLSRTTMLSAIKYTFSSYYIRRLIRRKSGYFQENRYWVNTSLTWTCNVLRILCYCEKTGSLQCMYYVQYTVHTIL